MKSKKRIIQIITITGILMPFSYINADVRCVSHESMKQFDRDDRGDERGRGDINGYRGDGDDRDHRHRKCHKPVCNRPPTTPPPCHRPPTGGPPVSGPPVTTPPVIRPPVTPPPVLTGPVATPPPRGTPSGGLGT